MSYIDPQQLAFDLPHVPATSRADFIVSDCNRAAYRLIDHTPKWPGGKLLLIGPPSSGKTHLTRIWQHEHAALRITSEDLEQDLVALASAHTMFILDDVEKYTDEAALFHFYNAVHARKRRLLLTASTYIHHWPFVTPDLISRMQAVPMAALEEPDDALLYQLLRKLFADRQLYVADSVLTFLIRRIERRFSTAQEIVAQLDKVALQTGRPLTRTLVQETLAQQSEIPA